MKRLFVTLSFSALVMTSAAPGFADETGQRHGRSRPETVNPLQLRAPPSPYPYYGKHGSDDMRWLFQLRLPKTQRAGVYSEMKRIFDAAEKEISDLAGRGKLTAGLRRDIQTRAGASQDSLLRSYMGF